MAARAAGERTVSVLPQVLAQAAAPVSEMRTEWLNAPPAWVLILVVVPAVVLFLTWMYRGERGSLTPVRRLTLGALRAAVLLCLVAALCEPTLVRERTQRESSYVLVLIDDSYSMGIADRFSDAATLDALERLLGRPFGTETSRLDLVQEVLSSERLGVIEELRRKANVRLVTGSDGIQVVRDLPRILDGVPLPAADAPPSASPPALELRGKVTRLGDSLYEAVNDLRGEAIAAVVLFTDGRDNGGVLRPEEAALRLRRREVPVHVIGVGNAEEPRDVRVYGLDIAEVVLKDDTVPVDFTVLHQGFAGRRVQVQLDLHDTATGRVLRGDARTITLGENGQPQPVRLEFHPRLEGRFRAVVEVETLEGELFTANNKAEKLVTVLAQKIKMLYVDGPPRWEYRFLTWSITRDPTLEAQVILTSADPDWIPESSAGVPPRRDFPTTEEDLFQYHLVIIGDVPPEYFTDQQQELIVKFVDDMGGGLVCIAGMLHMPYRYRGQPLERLFPVELEDVAPAGDGARNEFHVQLTPEGREHPVMQLVPDAELNLQLWQSMGRDEVTLPGFHWHTPVKRLRRGGVALAVHPFDSAMTYGPRPIFAYQYYGRGRTFLSLVDSTWRWRRFLGRRIFYRFWGQVLRFASAGRLLGQTHRFSVSTDQQEYTLGADARVLARVLDRNFKPIRDETYAVGVQRVDPPGEGRRSLEAVQLPARPEYFEATLTLGELGEHRVSLHDGDTEVASASFRVVVPQLEYAEPTMDRARLQRIAERSGGSYHEIHEVQSVAAAIEPLERETLLSSEQRPLWDHYGWLLLVVLFLTVEWVLRKVYRLL